ncbi:Adenosine deaminase-related growth factor A [Carabus blaptoides fortunei]
MRRVLLFVLCCIVFGCHADYWSDRAAFIRNEELLAFGSKIVLSPKEKRVNAVLMTAKWKELADGFKNPGMFPPAKHFFEAKPHIDESAVFAFIQQMPKAGALHIHDVAICTEEYVLHNITYRDNLYGCIEGDNIKLKFAATQPDDECWKLLKRLRQEAKSEMDFNKWLMSKITMITDNPAEKYPDVNTAWVKFISIFVTLSPMITYRPVFLDYFYNTMQEFYNDNVNYMEIRGTMPMLYELNGRAYGPVEVMGMLKQVAEQFLAEHPDFLGVKYIYAPRRKVDNGTMDDYIKNYKAMKQAYPDFLVGFDLVGQEDPGQPLISFINQLSQIASDAKFFFHAGETDWNGMSTDMNLVDAVLLNTTRIGHGYALVKHPVVMKEVKKRGIGIELNPISNQVLALVKDLRNHPGSVLFAQDYPIVVSADDPGLWGATGLSYDFYEAFMGLASRNADLRMLKQLCLNSLQYSALSHDEKRKAILRWESKWNRFLDVIISSTSSDVTVQHV